jgi:hypothetical protein
VTAKFIYENATAHVSQSIYDTLTRADYGGLSVKYPDTDLQKVISVAVTNYELQPLRDTIYTLDKPISIAPGATIVHEVSMDNPAYSVGTVAYTATTAGGWNITSDVTVTLTQYSQKLSFSIANANANAAVLRLLKVTGQAVSLATGLRTQTDAGQAVAAAGGTKQKYMATSADSFWDNVAERKREINNKYVQSYAQAGGLANAVLAANGTPLQVTTLDNVLGRPAIGLGTKLAVEGYQGHDGQ